MALTGADDWVRHYDNLLWTVTSICLALDGGLLAHSAQPDNFASWLALGGMWLTLTTVILATSFRELRQRFERQQEEGIRQLAKEGRRLYQWWWFLSLFVLLAFGWGALLIRECPQQTPLWGILTVLEVGAIIGIGIAFKKPKGHVAEAMLQHDAPGVS